MKLLAIDIGNTMATLGLYDGEVLCQSIRIPSKHGDFPPQKITLQQFVSEVDAVAIASVVPEVNAKFKEICETLYGTKPFFVTHETVKIPNKYDNPEHVGADRLCNAVWGVKKYGAPLTIVDFGTATTMDVISKKGEYLGGIIAPGIETASSDLAKRASKLGKIEFQFPQKIIGTSTAESMKSGILLGAVEMVDGLVKQIDEELGYSTKTIATGGLSDLIAKKSRTIQSVDIFITLHGIAEIFQMNNRSE